MEDHNATLETVSAKLKESKLPVTLFVEGLKPDKKWSDALQKAMGVIPKVDAVTEFGAQVTFKAA